MSERMMHRTEGERLLDLSPEQNLFDNLLPELLADNFNKWALIGRDDPYDYSESPRYAGAYASIDKAKDGALQEFGREDLVLFKLIKHSVFDR